MRKLTSNVTQESTTTAGAGTVTLALQTGWMRFSDRFAVGDLVYYSIRDGNNWEIGKGTIGAANTLARTTALETLTAGTVATAGVPLTLSGGTCIVRAVAPEEFLSTLVKAEFSLQGGNFNAVDGFFYGLTANGITATLSAAPVVNDRVGFAQAAATVTGGVINPNGALIEGVAGNMNIDIVAFFFGMVYTGAGYGWVIDR